MMQQLAQLLASQRSPVRFPVGQNYFQCNVHDIASCSYVTCFVNNIIVVLCSFVSSIPFIFVVYIMLSFNAQQ